MTGFGGKLGLTFKAEAARIMEPKTISSVIISASKFDPKDIMRNIFLPSSRAAAYFAFSPYKFDAAPPPFIADKGHVVEKLIIDKYFPNCKCQFTYFHHPLRLCATPDVITEDNDYVEIKTVQKKTEESLKTNFLDYFTEDGSIMKIEKAIEDCKKVNIVSHLIQCLVSLYILDDYNTYEGEPQGQYFLIYYIELLKEIRPYRILITDHNKFRGWMKMIAAYYEFTGKNTPAEKKKYDRAFLEKLQQFIDVKRTSMDQWNRKQEGSPRKE